MVRSLQCNLKLIRSRRPSQANLKQACREQLTTIYNLNLMTKINLVPVTSDPLNMHGHIHNVIREVMLFARSYSQLAS